MAAGVFAQVVVSSAPFLLFPLYWDLSTLRYNTVAFHVLCCYIYVLRYRHRILDGLFLGYLWGHVVVVFLFAFFALVLQFRICVRGSVDCVACAYFVEIVVFCTLLSYRNSILISLFTLCAFPFWSRTGVCLCGSCFMPFSAA